MASRPIRICRDYVESRISRHVHPDSELYCHIEYVHPQESAQCDSAQWAGSRQVGRDSSLRCR